jgi:hypothetical protein
VVNSKTGVNEMGITRKDNPDGTTTFSGVDVTIPTSLAKEYDVVEVRKPQKDDIVELSGVATKKIHAAIDSTYTILTPRPTWKPPKDLPSGEYRWNSTGLACHRNGDDSWMFTQVAAAMFYRNWSAPSKQGRWRVNEDGTATFLGET